MTRYPRARRNTLLECDCGAAVVKQRDGYVCVGCGKRVADGDAREARAGRRS